MAFPRLLSAGDYPRPMQPCPAGESAMPEPSIVVERDGPVVTIAIAREQGLTRMIRVLIGRGDPFVEHTVLQQFPELVRHGGIS
jgi:hypothetical protein